VSLVIKFYRFIIIALFLGSFTIAARAQVDYGVKFKVYVRSTAGATINDADVKVFRLNGEGKKDNTYKASFFENGAHKFLLLLLLGEIKLDFMLRVSAPGFVTSEQKIKLDWVRDPEFNVTLLTGLENTLPKMRLSTAIFDENGAIVVTARLTAARSDGKIFDALVNADGKYELDLPFGIYSIEAAAPGFRRKVFSDYRIVDATLKKMSLDFVLEVQSFSECLPIDPGQKKNNGKIETIVCM
jgi:hypothetical protein